MATRRSEWLASIKPILDRDEAKKDAAALAKELGDILEVKVDASPENLSELAKEFNAQLKTMGKQPIVFSEKTLRGIVSQFTKAISEGISAGVSNVDFSAELERLNKKRESIAKKYKKANRTMEAATRFRQLERFEIASAHTFKVDDNIEVKAREIAQNIYKAAEIIKSAKKQYGADSDEYIDAVLNGQEAYNKYLRMQKTFNEKLTVSQKLGMSSDVTSLFDRRSSKNEELEWFAADNILNHFEELSDVLNVSAGGVNKLKQDLVQIDNEIAKITQAMNGAGDGVVEKTENGLRTLDEIQKKYEKFKKKGKNEIRLQDQPKKHIEKATRYVPKENDGIKVFAQEYRDLATSDDWVEKYSALVRYVKLYESYLATDNKTHRNKVTDPKDPYGFTELYKELKPMAENAQNMLQNILNLGEGKPLVGMGGDGNGGAGSGPTPEDVANAQKIREESEAKVRAEREALELVRKKREEEEKIAKAAEKKRISDEAAAEANSKATEEAKKEAVAKKESQVYVGYRAVQPPDGSGKTKSDALEDWGAEYYTTGKDVAASYGEDFREKGDIIIGEITPKKPLIINAKGLNWNEFDKMPVIKELFPEVVDLMKQPRYIDDDGQKYINERARTMGYDAVILENVNDALDGDKKAYELSTTIAVLDDKIVHLTGSMEQLEVGTNKFSDKISPEIPSYYITGSQESGGASAEIQDVGTAFQKLIDYINRSGQEPKQFFGILAGGAQNVNDELKQILSTLGLFDSQGNLNLKSIESGFTNLGGIVSDTYTLIARGKDYLPKSQDLMPKLADAKQMGANVGEILDVFEDEATGRIYELQKTMPGTIIPDNTDFLQATDEQILKLIHDLEILHKTGLYVDFGNDNILYDKDKSFSFIDLGTRFQEGQETVAGTAQELIKSIKPAFADNELFGNFENRLVSIADGLGVKIPQAAKNTEQAVDQLNAELQKTEQITSGSGTSVGIGDSSSADPEAEKAKIEALQRELDKRNAELKVKNDEIQRVESENARLLESNEDLRNNLDTNNRYYGDALWDAEHRANVAEAKVQQLEQKLSEQVGDSSLKPFESIDTSKEQPQWTNLKDSVENVTIAIEAKTQAFRDEENVVKEIVAGEMTALEGLEKKISTITEKLKEITGNTADAIGKELTINVRHDTENPDGAGVSINQEQLQSVLKAITYNVNIVDDDNGSRDSKNQWENNVVTLLTRIKVHTHNTVRQIRDNLIPKLATGSSGVEGVASQQHKGSYALENTLQTVKGVLDNIQNNTAKIGTVGASPVDTLAGTALDGRLTEIKTVLESIDKKISKGGVIATRGAVKQASAQSVASDVKAQTARSNMLKSLVNDYKRLGKLSAQFASDDNLETKATLENLKEEIKRKRQSLKLTMDESASLREKYSIAFDAEKRLLDAEKAQADIDKKKKKDDQETEKSWKTKVKEAQRATGINAATSVANAGDQTVVRAIGTPGISQDIESKAKELAERIKTLRALRDEIDKKGEQATNEDRDNLSKKISKVKELKTEVDGYLKIHEKYSGDNVTDLGDASNFGAVGTDQYWNNITAAIKNVSSGKPTIKGLNADTGELTGTTKIAANTFATWSATVDPLTGRLSMLRTGIKKTETLVETITRKTKEIFTYFSGSSIIFKFFNELKRGVQYVREIDLALTELKKVTDETEEVYDKFLDTASKTAAKVGSTIKDVVSSTADWARLNI